VLSITWIPEKNGNWDLTYHRYSILSNMHIKYIWQAYRNKTTYKGGRGTWDLWCFETGSHFLVELSKTIGHNYCSLPTSVLDPGNFGTDSDHRIHSPKKGYGYIQIFMDFWHKSFLFGVLKCKKIQKCILPCENFNFVTKMSQNFEFRDTKFCEIKKLFREIRNKYFAKFHDRKILSTTLILSHTVTQKTSESRDSRALVARRLVGFIHWHLTI
jgi:hypothetical protein